VVLLSEFPQRDDESLSDCTHACGLPYVVKVIRRLELSLVAMTVRTENGCNTSLSFHMHRGPFDEKSDLTATYVGEGALHVPWSLIRVIQS
jgi:hypothetical protein